MMVAVCYRNVRKQVSKLASAYKLSRCLNTMASVSKKIRMMCLSSHGMYCMPVGNIVIAILREVINERGVHSSEVVIMDMSCLAVQERCFCV